MIIYYLDAEYEPNKHKIVKVWFEGNPLPEESSRRNINIPHSVIEFDEKYNRMLAEGLRSNTRINPIDDTPLPDKYYVNNLGEIVISDTDTVVTVNPNPQKESYKLSALYGMTQAELETYIDTNVVDLPTARAYIKKLSAIVLWLVKQSGLDE